MPTHLIELWWYTWWFNKDKFRNIEEHYLWNRPWFWCLRQGWMVMYQLILYYNSSTSYMLHYFAPILIFSFLIFDCYVYKIKPSSIKNYESKKYFLCLLLCRKSIVLLSSIMLVDLFFCISFSIFMLGATNNICIKIRQLNCHFQPGNFMNDLLIH